MTGTAAVAFKALGEPSRAALCIKRVDAIPVALPLRKPMLMAGVRIEFAENLIVRIEAESGLVGWGEAASAPTMTGDLQAGMVAAIEQHLAPLLVGQDALQHAALARRCGHALHGNGGAKSAVDMALLDLVGRHVQLPVCDLLGGAMRATVKPM
jgi:L-alanine-DL-glutamate epimerase-like enolase superfamily enzyme